MTKKQDRDIKKVLKEAAEAVKDLPKELKVKAFELVFNNMMSSNDDGKIPLSKSIGVTSESGDFFAKMRKETKIQESELKSIFRLNKDNEIKVIVPLTGTKAEKQRSLAYLYFFAKKMGFGTEWVSALEFAQQTGEYGINDTHVSKNLGQDETNIRQHGRKRGKEYSLTPNGVIKAKEVLQSFITT